MTSQCEEKIDDVPQSVHSNSNVHMYKIPNIIHQTFIDKKLPPDIAAIVLRNKRIRSYCKFVFYDDKYFNINILGEVYKSMYRYYNTNHYGEYNESFYK